MVGRLFAWKGHHLLLQAMAMLQDSGLRAHALIVGGGGHRGDTGYERSLARLVVALGLEDWVTFTGQVADAAPYLPLMDVFVNASAEEPFGLVALEAMAAGVPVVAVHSAGPSEMIEHGRSGVLVPSNGPRDLADGLERLLADRESRTRIAAEGRIRFEQRFTAKRMASEMDRRLCDLAAGAAGV